jgi:hypothetical protein
MQMLSFQDIPSGGPDRPGESINLIQICSAQRWACEEGTIKCSIFVHANNDFVDVSVRGKSLPGFDLLVEEFSGFVERRDVMRLSLPGASH